MQYLNIQTTQMLRGDQRNNLPPSPPAQPAEEVVGEVGTPQEELLTMIVKTCGCNGPSTIRK